MKHEFQIQKRTIQFVDFPIVDFFGYNKEDVTIHIDTAFKREDKMDPNKPEPAPKGAGIEITPLVIKDLEERSKMGAAKYGETLRAHNGRNALVDAYQEALDLVQYLRQKMEEDADIARASLIAAQMKVSDKTIQDELDAVDLDMQPIMTPVPAPGLDVKNLYSRPGRFIPVSGNPVEAYEEFRKGIKFTPFKGGSESIAQEAHRLVLGDRGESYGHPIFDMTRSADLLTSLLRNKLRVGVRLEAEDIGQAMICVKQSRQRNKAKRDNLVDTAGYALTLHMIAEWREQHPNLDPRDAFPAA